jgi:hypothetical protein
MKVTLLTALAVAALTGCQQSFTSPAPVQAAVQKPAPPPPATAKDWKDAVVATYKETEKKDEGDGVYTAWACFDPEGVDPPKFNKDGKKIPCGEQGMKLTRDGFRKVSFFHPPSTTFNDLVGKYIGGVYLGSYISLTDCGAPKYFLRAKFDGKSWIFMNTVAVMVHGEIVMERDFKDGQVKRDVEHGRIEERYDFVATDNDIAGVQKMIDAADVKLRITGDKGYVSLDPKQVESLKDDARRMKRVFEKLSKAVAGKIPPSCT